MDFHDEIDRWDAERIDLAVDVTVVCGGCVTDTDLWASVEEAASEGECAFCHATAPVVTFEDLAAPIEDVLNGLYVSFEESGAYHDEGGTSADVDDIQVVMDELLTDAVDSPVLGALALYMSNRNAGVAYGYVLRNEQWATLYDFDEGDWRDFMRRTREGVEEADAESIREWLTKETLAMFQRIEQVAFIHHLFRSGSPSLWRCRPGDESDRYTTGAALGSPPDGKGASGRLNAPKQSFFYGSTTLQGAVVEVASHREEADPTMWGGNFIPSQDLLYLDVMEVPEPPSLFAPDGIDTRDALAFLGRFADSMSEPRIKGRDARHYVPTQVFVAYLVGVPAYDRIDAIRYKSSLDSSSENWVVFVDNQHCVDELPVARDGLYLQLSKDTAQFTHLAAFA